MTKCVYSRLALTINNVAIVTCATTIVDLTSIIIIHTSIIN